MHYCDRLFDDLNRLAASPHGEKRLVRELAVRVMDLARAPRMQAVKQRWRDVLALRNPDRPPVWCNPVGCWSELLPEETVVCRTADCRKLEVYFKRLLIKDAIGDDTPINDYYRINAVFDIIPSSTWGLDIVREKLDSDGSAWRYQPALSSVADFDRLVIPRYQINRASTEAARVQLADILNSTMPVQVSPISGFYDGATLCQPAVALRGMEQFLLDMVEAPELAHRLMETVYRGEMARLDAIVAAGNILPNTDCAMLLSDPLRRNPSEDYGLQDCWIHGNSQEFDTVSPTMFNEFLLEYQKKVFARFGAACYGCCENLTRKLDYVLSIPNLSLVTCSAWTDLSVLLNKVSDHCCIMWRHKASDVVCPHSTAELSANIHGQAKLLKGHHYQVVLRELQTLMGHPERLSEWTRLTVEAVSKQG